MGIRPSSPKVNLFKAIRNYDTRLLVKVLTEHEELINEKTEHGNSALCLAIDGAYLASAKSVAEITKILIKFGASPFETASFQASHEKGGPLQFNMLEMAVYQSQWMVCETILHAIDVSPHNAGKAHIPAVPLLEKFCEHYDIKYLSPENEEYVLDIDRTVMEEKHEYFDEIPCYPRNEANKKGLAVLVGNGNTHEMKRCCERDTAALEAILESAGYEVIVKNHIGTDQIACLLRKYQQMSGFDSFIFYFSGHGKLDTIIGGDDQSDEITIKELTDTFHRKRGNFDGKPKIFLWDCCRGNMKFAKGVESECIDENEYFKEPSYNDCLYAYATVPSYTAFSAPQECNGLSVWTYFLTERLKRQVQTKKQVQLTDLLTYVRYDVEKFNVKYPEKKLRPSYNNVLSKFFVL